MTQMIYSKYCTRKHQWYLELKNGEKIYIVNLPNGFKTISCEGKNLEGVHFSQSFQDANFKNADLRKANFEGAHLPGANFEGAKLPKFQIPQAKSLIVWKKVWSRDPFVYSNEYIAAILKLRIPARARRTISLVSASATGQKKCRAERAFVESAHYIYKIDDVNPTPKSGNQYESFILGEEIKSKTIILQSAHSLEFEYKIGKEIIPNSYDPDIGVECTNGIHFFMDLDRAIKYNL